MDTTQPEDSVLLRFMREALESDEPLDMVYPVGGFIDGAGPNGELVRYTSPDDAYTVLPPHDNLMRILRFPLPASTVHKLLAHTNVPDFVLPDLLEGRWLVSVPDSRRLDPTTLAGLRLLPNIAQTAAADDDDTTIVLTSQTTGSTATVPRGVLAVLKHGVSQDVPAAVEAASAETGLDATWLGELVMDSLSELLTANAAYLSETPS